MFSIPMRSTGPLDRQTIMSVSRTHIQGPRTYRNINTPGTAPPLVNTVRKGQKITLGTSGELTRIKACLGWDTTDTACDVDVSAFLLDSTGKVPGDSWFVFYGQRHSPDKSTAFLTGQGACREIISIDFTRLDPSVTKIVFVLTIDEAIKKHLDFSMVKDACIRLTGPSSSQELVSFRMEEYYPDIISMMIGEIYEHNGTWKFNAIGNGVAKDLAGLCALYGVQVI